MKYTDILKSLYGAICTYGTISKAFNVLWKAHAENIKKLKSYEALDDDIRELECIIKLYISNMVELAKVRGDIEMTLASSTWTFCFNEGEDEIAIDLPDTFIPFFMKLARDFYYNTDYSLEKKWFSLEP